MKARTTRTKRTTCAECIFSLLGDCSDCPKDTKYQSDDASLLACSLNLQSSAVDLSLTFDGKTYPRTPEEFIEQGWLHRVYRRLSKFALKDVCNRAEDLAIDIFINIIRPSEASGSSYLERYDPKSRPFGVYLFTAVNNEVRRRGRRESTDTGKKLTAHLSFEISHPDNGELAPFTYYDEYIQDNSAQEQSDAVSAQHALNSLVSELRGKPNSEEAFRVLKLMLKGYTPSQVASYMNKPKKEIVAIVRRIRGCKSIQKFRTEHHASRKEPHRAKKIYLS